MTLTEAKEELDKFVRLKTTMRPTFADVLMSDDVVEVRHGRWVDLHCSVCGKIGWMDEDNYCPNCGAKMEEDKVVENEDVLVNVVSTWI